MTDQEQEKIDMDDYNWYAKEKSILVNDVSIWSERKRKIEEECLEYENKKKELSGVESKLLTKQKEFQDKEIELNQLALTLEEKIRESNKLSVLIASSKNNLSILNGEETILLDTLKEKDKEFRTLIFNNEKLIAKNKELEERTLKLNDEGMSRMREWNNQLNLLDSKIKEQERQISINSEVSIRLEKDSEKLREESKKLSTEIITDNALILNLRNEILSLEIMQKSLIDSLHILKDQNQIECNKKESELAEREGKVSIKESLLEEKISSLREAKMELEVYYNKPINLVI